MNKKKSILEENIRQMLQTGFTIDDRPAPRLREKTYRRLKKQLRRQISVHEFSNTVLGLLCGLLYFLVTWFALNLLSDLDKTLNNIPLLIIGGIFFLNVISIPIAGYVIVKRRRHA